MHIDASNNNDSNGVVTPGEFGARERLAIWLLLASAFVVILNETIMGVALPKLMTDLGITASAGQWLTTAYLLTMSVVIPITGMLIQRTRTRTLFMIAMGLFSLGTLIAAVAPGFGVLLIGRIVQAGGTAIMMPLLMTTVVTMVPANIRGQLMGRIAIVISVAPALGPTVSGIILQWLSWRWLFIFVLPIALTALIVGLIRMPNVGVVRKARIDIFSVILSAFGFGGIVYGLSSLGKGGGDAAIPAWVPLAIGVVSLAIFVLRQLKLQRTDAALLDLRTFAYRPFALSAVLFVLASIALFGSLILLPIFVQSVLGVEILEAGLAMLPGGLVMGLLGPIVGRLVDRFGARPVLLPGAIITALSLWGMALFTDTTQMWQVILTHVVMSVGLAGVFTPLFTVSLGSLPLSLASHGSATLSTVQQVGGAAGTAIFITVMTLVSANAAGAADVVSPAALSEGTSVAFMMGGLIMTFGAILAFWVREEPLAPAVAGSKPVAGH